MENEKEVLLFTLDFNKASEEIISKKGRLSHKFTDTVFVAFVPENFKTEILKNASEKVPTTLDKTSKLMVKAWKSVLKGANNKSKLAEEKPLTWDIGGKFETPKHPDNDEKLRTKDEDLKKNLTNNLTITNETMTGKIIVGIVIVSGPTVQNLNFSSVEQANTITQIMLGTRFLTLSAPAEFNLYFVYDSHYIIVDTLPSPVQCTNQNFQVCEAVFRDPALTQMGYQTGYQGCVDYVNHLSTFPNVNGAYVSFFTKYPLYHFAYQYGINLYMQYSNDGWGPNRINQVFAHESCHIFGAADEYAGSGCTCAPSGKYQIANNNCDNCSYQPKVPCLMNANTLSICTWSQGQIGWYTPPPEKNN